MQGTIKSNRVFTTSTLVKVAILSSIGYMLMFISIPIPTIFPDFLKIDISDLTAVLGGIAMGPIAGITIELLKNLLQFITGFSTTGGVGEFANFLIGSSFVLSVSYIYRINKNRKNVIIGMILGMIFMAIVGCLSNYFIMLPLYASIGFPIELIVAMGSAINPNITDKLSFVLWMIAPFNILKAMIISLITLPIYTKIEKVLTK